MNISFLGDIMLGRLVSNKYRINPYQIVNQAIVNDIKRDFVLANLESPIVGDGGSAQDHMCFGGYPEILNQLDWINLFSTANNHINDFGDAGISNTIRELEQRGFKHNGIYQGKYVPYINNSEKIAIITLTDLMNHEIGKESEYKLLRMDSPDVINYISEYSKKGFFVIVFAHVGMLFTRYPNPITYDYLHQYVDSGAKLIVTAHSHCLGGIEYYKEVPIIHSLGDFLMDGSSYRRRRAAFLSVTIENQQVKSLTLHPIETSFSLTVDYPNEKILKKMLKSVATVSNNIGKHASNYPSFYRFQYNKEMISHSLSTVAFLYDTLGLIGFFKIIVKRIDEVVSMLKWSIIDRSNIQSDTDALNVKNNVTEDDFIKMNKRGGEFY